MPAAPKNLSPNHPNIQSDHFSSEGSNAPTFEESGLTYPTELVGSGLTYPAELVGSSLDEARVKAWNRHRNQRQNRLRNQQHRLQQRKKTTPFHFFSTSKTLPLPKDLTTDDVHELISAAGQSLLSGVVHRHAGVSFEYAPGERGLPVGVRNCEQHDEARSPRFSAKDAQSPRLSTRQGQVVVVKIGFINAPCLVLKADVTPTSTTLVYGTLPGHPECGEESFRLQWVKPLHEGATHSGYLHATVSAFSRPASWYTRLGGPIARGAQKIMAERYAQGLLDSGWGTD